MLSKRKLVCEKWKPKVASLMKINYNKSDVLLTDAIKILFDLQIIIDILSFLKTYRVTDIVKMRLKCILS